MQLQLDSSSFAHRNFGVNPLRFSFSPFLTPKLKVKRDRLIYCYVIQLSVVLKFQPQHTSLFSDKTCKYGNNRWCDVNFYQQIMTTRGNGYLEIDVSKLHGTKVLLSNYS